MKDINNYNYVYDNYDVTIIVKDKIVTYINKRINVFELIITKNDKTTLHLGDFYAILPRVMRLDDIKLLISYLIDNLDVIIYNEGKYVGVLSEGKIKKDKKISHFLKEKFTKKYDIEMMNIYKEYFELKKDSKKYKEYSYFLELEFNTHRIPDTIKDVYLKNKRKSILNYNDNTIELEIKKDFQNNMYELDNENEYDNNMNKINSLKRCISSLLKEIKCIEDTLTNVLDVSIKIEENNKIVNEISLLDNKINKMSIFSIKRFNLRKKIKSLEKSLTLIDEREFVKEIKNKNAININCTDINELKNVLNKNYKNKCREYDRLIKEYDDIFNKIEEYKENRIDIGLLRERIDNI